MIHMSSEMEFKTNPLKKKLKILLKEEEPNKSEQNSFAKSNTWAKHVKV